MPNLAVIILNYRSLPHTLECLKWVTKMKWSGKLSIIVIDNSHQSRPIKTEFPQIEIITNPTNIGFAQGNNLGVQKAVMAKSELVMLLNNDTKVDTLLAENLYKAMKAEKADIAVPKIYFYPGNEFHYDRYQPSERGKVIWYAGGHIDWDNIMGIHHGVDLVDQGQFDKRQEIEFATGCCLMIMTKVINRIGLFDPKYFLYLEDADFSVRAKKAGYKIIYAPQAMLWHKNAESSGGSGSSLQDYYFTRNRLLFGWRYASFKTKLALIKESLRLLTAGSLWQKKGVVDFYLHRFGQGSYY